MDILEVFATLTFGGKTMTDTITRETCDRCGPAVAAAVLTSEGLTFCAHCARTIPANVSAHLAPLGPEGFIIDKIKTPDEAPEQVVPRHSRPATADPDYPL